VQNWENEGGAVSGAPVKRDAPARPEVEPKKKESLPAPKPRETDAGA